MEKIKKEEDISTKYNNEGYNELNRTLRGIISRVQAPVKWNFLVEYGEKMRLKVLKCTGKQDFEEDQTPSEETFGDHLRT